MEFSDQALVIHVGKFKEADLWVRFLSAKRGLFTAFAFGGSRSRRRFCGCLDILNQVSVRVSRPKNGGAFLNLQEGSLLAGPQRLRKDIDRLGLAINCLKFIQSFEISPESAPDAHAAACGLLELLENASAPPPLLPLFFRLRLSAGQGFAPRLDSCRICGRKADSLPRWTFNPSLGGIACPACSPSDGQSMRLSAPSVQILRQVSASLPQAWGELAVSADLRRECGEAIDAFIHYHVGVAWGKNGFQRI